MKLGDSVESIGTFEDVGTRLCAILISDNRSGKERFPPDDRPAAKVCCEV